MITAIFWFVFAVFLALLEIEVEGKAGWAHSLPTWYRTTGLAKVYGFFMGNKPWTGYHTYLLCLLILIFHIPFLNTAWSLSQELFQLSLLATIAIVWDFLWFVLNPYFGYQNFKKEKIWWHALGKWLWGFPLGFYLVVIIGLILNLWINLLVEYLTNLIIFGSGTLIVMLLSPYYRKFYWYMRKKDERN